MSRDPQAGSNESGLVPPQGSDRAEWPKRLRSLTADELDRLTIDRDGRFYWDGKPVSYGKHPQAASEPAPAPGETPTALQPTSEKTSLTEAAEDKEREAIDMLDRVAAEIAHKPSEKAEEPPAAADAETPTVVQTKTLPPVHTIERIEPAMAMTPVAPVIQQRATDTRMRLKLSFWQSLMLFLVVIALLATAVGVAASGLIAAHEWGCRAGVIKMACPAQPAQPTGSRIRD